jgi:hypothetical protein
VINIYSELLLKIALAERPLNPDQQINHGCNLKWKLGQDEEDLFLVDLLINHQTDPKLK